MSTKHKPYRVGEWLSSDQESLNKWLINLTKKSDPHLSELHPVIKEFKDLIEEDPKIYMLFHQMFEQVPHKTPYNLTPDSNPQVRDYHHMLSLLNSIMTHAPEFNKTGLVGCPINAIFDWSMGTTAGYAVFLNDKVNAQLKKILMEWGSFLTSKESTTFLTDDPRMGWFGEDAKAAMPHFVEEFECDPSKPHHGFHSWDDFFTRKFREGVRPVAEPDNDSIITNACESAPYRISKDVKLADKFWIKSQPYSLTHMLDNDELTKYFVGGTVYQAFLSALSYHRWHSPVTGKIVKAYNIEGTYYSEALSTGFKNTKGPDDAGPNESQGYITDVAARAVIFIEADNPAIGLMAILFVGMAEVSSNDLTIKVGQRIKKGEQLGMFHFGGSTHCLIFSPEVNIKFDLQEQTPGLDAGNINLNSKIAEVVS